MKRLLEISLNDPDGVAIRTRDTVDCISETNIVLGETCASMHDLDRVMDRITTDLRLIQDEAREYFDRKRQPRD